MTNVIDINQDQFVEEVVEKSKTIPVIVDFWAPWCGPCKQLTPMLENLVNKKNGKVILAKINVDDNQELSGKYGITSIPCLIVFKNGEEVGRITGAGSKEMIEEKIKGYFG